MRSTVRNHLIDTVLQVPAIGSILWSSEALYGLNVGGVAVFDDHGLDSCNHGGKGCHGGNIDIHSENLMFL